MAFTPVQVTDGTHVEVAYSASELNQYLWRGWQRTGEYAPPLSRISDDELPARLQPAALQAAMDAEIAARVVGAVAGGAIPVVHGATASTARPATTQPVIWFGTVSPTNADATLDVYVPVSSDGGAAALASLQTALANKADLTGGVVPDAQLPARLSDAVLKAAYVAALPSAGSFTYNPDGTIASDPDGNTYTWNTDGTPNTQTKGGVTRTFHWNTDGTLASVS